jgi:formylglycine-generating enzyme required for sulfatase activity/serine/threonine protein kinase
VTTPAAMPVQLGRYRILKKLGAGGMGTVYLAEDGEIRRRVALKVPHFDADDGPEVIQRFRREAQVAGAIDHPHICPIYDVGEDHGSPFLVMPYIEGTPLANRIDPERPWPVPQAVSLVRQMALAIEVMHQKGIIHRDLKPANVMIRTSGEPVLMDFGLARASSQRLTHTGQAMGTPAYMSPEQVLGDPAGMGPATDVYSLGVILYQLLTGVLPFEGPMVAVYGQILHGTPLPPSKRRSELPAALDALCLKALAKKATERYASMTAFAQRLQEYMDQSLLTATRPTKEPQSTPLLAEPSRTRVGCPYCGAILKLPAGSSDWKVRCPKCQKALGVASALRPLDVPSQPTSAASPLPATPPPTGSQTGPMHISWTPGDWRQPLAHRRGLFLGALAVGLLVFCLFSAGVWLGLYGSRPPNTSSSPNQANADTTKGEPRPVPTNKDRGQAGDIDQSKGKDQGKAKDIDHGKEKEQPPQTKPIEILPRELTNSIGMKLILIPHGKFKMGSPKGEVGPFADEMPQHEVEISTSFYLGVYPVTVGQLRQFVQETNYKTDAETDGIGSTWRDVGWEQSDEHPVVYVAWKDAVQFCQWLGQKEQKTYELPTEAEWEYACRAGTETVYFFGNDVEKLTEYAWFSGNSGGKAHAVGQKKANPWGLFDMHGNVWQWCADGKRWYEERYIKDPRGASNNRPVLRGGSWGYDPGYCRAAFRNSVEPGYRSNVIGFRVVLRAGPRIP